MIKNKTVRLTALVLVLVSLLPLLVGCIPYDKKWAKFRTLEDNEIYYFEIDDTNYFWYSEPQCYGEWVKGDERVLLTMAFTRGYHFDPRTDCILRFHDEYGSCMAELTLHMDTYTRLKTNYNSSRCESVELPVIYMEEHRERIEGLLDGVEFVLKRIKKIQKDVGDHTPVQASIEQFSCQYAVYVCEELGLWYESYVYGGYQHMTGKMRTDGEWIQVDLSEISNYRSSLEPEPCDTLFVFPENSNSSTEPLAGYFICQDENGFYLLNTSTRETGRLVIATPETDPRKDDPYFIFLQPIDEEGYACKFVCESEGFSFDMTTGTGVWTNGNDSIFIKVEMEYWGSLTVEDHKGYDTLLWGDFDGMVDENNARFTVRGYEGIVPPTEIIITKQRVIDAY